MSDQTAEVKIGADIGGAVAGINQVKASLESLNASTREMARATAGRAAATRADLKAHTDALVATFQAEQDLAAGAKVSAGAMAGLGLNTQYARREMMTLGREILTGNMARAPITFGSLLSHSNLLAAAFSPTGMLVLGIGAAAAAMGYLAVKGEEADRTFAQLQARMAGEGTGGLFSNLGLKDLLAQLAALPGMSRASADATISALAGLRNVGQDTFREIALTVNDFAAATGQKAPAAARTLAAALADPAKGAMKLHDELGILNAQQIIHIETLDREGQRLEAQKELLAAVQARTKGLADAGLTPLQKATEGLENAWVKFEGSLGDNSSEGKIIADLASLERGITSLIDKLTGTGMAKALANLGSALRYGPIAAPTVAAYDAIFGGSKGGSQSSGGKIGAGSAAGGGAQSDTQAEVNRQVLLAQSMKGPTAEITKMRQELVGLKKAKAEATDPADVKILDGAIATLNDKIAKEQYAMGAGARKASEEARQAALTQVDSQIALSKKGLEQQIAFYDGEAAAKRMTEVQKVEAVRAATEAEYQMELGLMARKAELEKRSKDEVAQLIAQHAVNVQQSMNAEAAAERKAADDRVRLEMKALKEIDAAEKAADKKQQDMIKAQQKAWESVFSPIGNAFANMAKGVAQGTESLRKGLSNVWSAILGEFISMAASIGVEWAGLEAYKLATTTAGSAARDALDQKTTLSAILRAKMAALGFTTTETAKTAVVATGTAARTATEDSANAASIASTISTAMTKIGAYLATAFAGEVAFLAPTLGPFAVPAAIAIDAAAAAGAYKMMSASGGYDVPAGVNPVTQLHAREMVLPAGLSDRVRNMTVGDDGGTHLHIHTAYADAAGIKRMVMQHGSIFAQGMRAQVRAATSTAPYSPLYPA